MNGQPHGASHGQPHGHSAQTASAKTRHRTTPDRTGPEHLSWSPLHACRHLGNARPLIGGLGLTHLRDDMDAATRWRSA